MTSLSASAKSEFNHLGCITENVIASLSLHLLCLLRPFPGLNLSSAKPAIGVLDTLRKLSTLAMRNGRKSDLVFSSFRRLVIQTKRSLSRGDVHVLKDRLDDWNDFKDLLGNDPHWLLPVSAVRRNRPSKKRRRTMAVRGLTERQNQAMTLYGRHDGKIKEVAREMGITHATVIQHLNAVWRKLPQLAPKKTPAAGKTRRLPTDRRGQVSV